MTAAFGAANAGLFRRPPTRDNRTWVIQLGIPMKKFVIIFAMLLMLSGGTISIMKTLELGSRLIQIQ